MRRRAKKGQMDQTVMIIIFVAALLLALVLVAKSWPFWLSIKAKLAGVLGW